MKNITCRPILGTTLLILFSSLAIIARAQPTPPGGGGGGSGGGGGGSFDPPDYGSNLWIRVDGIFTNSFVGIVSNTEPDIQYEIQSITNLAQANQTNWNSEGFIFGSEITNWTALGVNLSGRTNSALFFRIRSWLDTFDMGIPDWWQLEFFGMIGIDPYGDPAGDGYSNLYKYQHGLNPFTSYAPQPPTFSVTPTATDSGEVISWNPAQGAVTSYTIYRNNSAITTVSASTFSYTDSTSLNLDDPDDDDYATYAVQANYSGSSYLAEAEPPFNPKWTISPAIVRGSQGQYILLVPNIPSGVTTIRFYPQPSGADYPNDFFNIETYLQSESSFTPSSTTNIIDVPVGSFTTNGVQSRHR
jgi:hypothetical protein